VRSGRVPTQEVCPCGVGVHHSPSVDEVTPWKAPQPRTLEISWRPHCSISSPSALSGGRGFGLGTHLNSVTQSCPTLCNPTNHSTTGLPIHHQLPEFTQTHVHRVGDAIQPFNPLSSPSLPAPNPSQHQGLFQ